MKRLFFLMVVVLIALQSATAQQGRTVQNRPYTDLRPFHLGLFVGTHVQDLESMNVGPQVIENEDGSTTTRLITCDQDRWDGGFLVGVLGEFRLHEYFQFRVAPAMYFGVRHVSFYDYTPTYGTDPADVNDEDEQPSGRLMNERIQNIKTAYITCALDLIAASKRNGNVRPYALVGLNPMINLSGGESDILKLKRTDLFFEIGAGCDFYLPFFKLRPELKFMFGLTDCLDHKHADRLRDVNLRAFSNSVSKATSKMVTLTFYFE